MTSPPRLGAAAPYPLNRLSDSGAPRGNDRKISAYGLKTPAHASGLGFGRVMRVDTRSFKQGQTIRPALTYALRAPNGQRIPIPARDLHNWIEDHFKWGVNKKRAKTLYARETSRGMWQGAELDGTPLRRGAWTLLQSDEDFAGIPQMHTLPLSKLTFDISESGHLVARYLKDRTPTAISFQTSAVGVHTENTI